MTVMSSTVDAGGDSAAPFKVLLLENISEVAVAAFRGAGYEVVTHAKLSEEQLLEAVADVTVIGVRSKTKLPQRVLAAAPRLLAVGCFCIGTDQTDLDAAAEAGVPVFNAPFANTRSVAEMVVCCITALARGVPDAIQQMHRGVWKKVSRQRYEVRGKTLGIVGYGHVGSQLSVLAEAMGMTVLYYDIERKMPLGNAVAVASLDQLLAAVDFVSLHVPLTPQTHQMVDASVIANMKQSSYLINYSRGAVCDTAAVAEALRRGHLAGAAFDVYPNEPGHGEPFSSPLMGCPNTILTPHIGGSTEEAQAAIGEEVSSKIIDYLAFGSSVGATNLPEVSLVPDPAVTKTLLANVHRNVPGVLRDINNVLGEYNVSAQMLGTSGNVGYIICRIDTDVSSEVGCKIAQLPHSIRTRILH